MDFSKIKVLMTDIDGVLTNGEYTITASSEGISQVSKSFYTRDFYAIELVLRQGLRVAIVSQSHDDVIIQQLERISAHSEFWRDSIESGLLHIVRGTSSKTFSAEIYLESRDLTWEDTAYIGDAENDLGCMEKAGITGCPSDAIENIKENSHFISDSSGGRGCLYDFIMYILKGKDNEEASS